MLPCRRLVGSHPRAEADRPVVPAVRAVCRSGGAVALVGVDVNATTHDHHEVEIDGLRRALPLFEVAPGLRIAVFNLLGDTEVVAAAAAALAQKLHRLGAEALVTAETKSVPLVYELARQLGKPWGVLRESYQPDTGDAL